MLIASQGLNDCFSTIWFTKRLTDGHQEEGKHRQSWLIWSGTSTASHALVLFVTPFQTTTKKKTTTKKPAAKKATAKKPAAKKATKAKPAKKAAAPKKKATAKKAKPDKK